jgi:hypothetical protein
VAVYFGKEFGIVGIERSIISRSSGMFQAPLHPHPLGYDAIIQKKLEIHSYLLSDLLMSQNML